MMPPVPPPRIAWLINLLHDSASQHAHAAAVLRATAQRLGATVSPVFCLASAEPELAHVESKERTDVVRDRLLRLMQELKLPTAPPIVIPIDDGDPSVKEIAAAAAEALGGTDVMFTVVHTQRHSALDRLFVGSFSEQFFTRARRPVLVLNPHVSNPDTYDAITFASDLSDESIAAFHRFLPLATGLKAAVRIEHQIRVSELGAFMQSTSAREQYARELADAQARAEQRADGMLAAAKAAGVQAEFAVYQESASEPSGEGFEQRAAQANTPMLAISAHGERRWPGNIGSTALWLMRNAQRPVLVMPPVQTD